jgi:transposase
MNNENSSPHKRPRYAEAFKRAAVEQWLTGGKSAAKLCQELGISTQSLKIWKKQLAALPPTGLGQRSVEQLEEENRRLKRELHRLAQQRDILKKTLGIISTPSDAGLPG